jgi:hypothetical protein
LKHCKRFTSVFVLHSGFIAVFRVPQSIAKEDTTNGSPTDHHDVGLTALPIFSDSAPMALHDFEALVVLQAFDRFCLRERPRSENALSIGHSQDLL